MFVKDVLDLWYSDYGIVTKRLAKEETKKELIDSITTSNVIEIEELNKRAEKLEKSEDASAIIKQYEEIIGTKTKNIVSIAYHQGKVFKRFKEKEKVIHLFFYKQSKI